MEKCMQDDGLHTSNYDMMRNSMELEFAKHDQAEMIRKFHLKHDADFLYIRFVGRDYRINRSCGRIEWFFSKTESYIHANYNESMTIFDMLTYSKRDCSLAGQYVPINGLRGTVKTTSAEMGIFSSHAKFFVGRCDDLKAACLKLGGQPNNVGDVSSIIPLFDFFPVMMQFWDADEEFDAKLKFMWDLNATDFMHYESIAFATDHLVARLRECMDD